MIRTSNLVGSVSRNAGGLFESVRRLVQSLAQSGMEVCVFGLEDEFTEADLPTWSPVKVSVFRPTWPKQFGYSRRFLEELAAFSPDITHTHGTWLFPSVATNCYIRRKKCPYIISSHGMLDPWAIRNSKWKKTIAYFLYEETHLRGASCLRALCEAEARAIRKLGLKNPIAIIPNGIDLQKPVDGGELMVDSQLRRMKADGRKVLLYLGRIHPKKGLPNLLRAWSEVQRTKANEARDWVLAIAGWDQDRHEKELRVLSAECGMEKSVMFLGPQFGEDKAECYRKCNGFVLPSFSEGLPMVILEAWAHGKPVMMTPQCNLPEGLVSRAAICIEPSVSGVASGLQTLFAMSGDELKLMGKRGHDLVATQFGWPRMAGKMKELYEWVLGGGAKPSCLAEF